MKNCHVLLNLLVLPAILFFSGCLDMEVKTTVASDGSSERLISFRSNSRQLPDGLVPWASDSSWSVTWKELAIKDSRYECTAHKRFASPEELNNEYSSRPDTGVIGMNISLAKRFEWFYTYFDYREAYVMHNRNITIPVSRFLTNEEIERYVRGEKSDSLAGKVKMWDARNFFEWAFTLLLQESERLNDPAIAPSVLQKNKESIFSVLSLIDSQSSKEKITKEVVKKEDEDIKEGLYVLRQVLKTPAVDKFSPALHRIVATFLEGDRKHPDTWSSAMQMPGLLLETNSTAVEGNLVSWKFTSDQIHVGEYNMTASSRVTNVWAFAVTGAAVILLVLISLRSVRRRRRLAGKGMPA